ncbi:hypothetical protein MHF_1074 [Mycoplasma haemofelis Ohio2]|uniref:Uncharacterized protein n=1 Tax=Mycoplasma haemofelis (strain Ohio2) TaxID=859194 RepID=F6FJG9_MYCHI|nr:hypothetical protein MHF_1074 [Mycoplasma haemofelis Ohio2]
MPIASVKLLKIGGPILAGTGGSAAVYSVVSRNSGGKGEEQVKTASAKDQEVSEQPQQESETRTEQTGSQAQQPQSTVESPKAEAPAAPKEQKRSGGSFYSWFSGWWG